MWLAALGTPVSIFVGLVIVIGTYWRRPNLTLHNRPDEWRVERNSQSVPIPAVRLVAQNGRLHRGSQGTRVHVEGYRRVGQSDRVPLGSVPLGWTSAADEVNGGVVIFPGGERPVDLGTFQAYSPPPNENASPVGEWAFAVAPNFPPFDGRNVLRARRDGYIIRVIIGANDGRARRYDVHLNWNPDKRLIDNEWNAADLMNSVQLELLPAD